MEGIAYGLRTALEGLDGKVRISDPVILTGGGAKSALWQRIYADVFGRSVVSSSIGQQCAALGAAAVAAVGSGLWSDFSPLTELSAVGEVVEPNEEAMKSYTGSYSRFLSLSRHLAAWGDE